MVQIDFNADEVETPSTDLIQPQWLQAQLVAAEVKPTADETGRYLDCTFAVDGDMHPEIGNRKVWTKINFLNKSEKCQAIGKRDLARLCKSCSNPHLTDTDQLLGIPVAIKIKIEKKSACGTYPEKNDIASFEPASKHFSGGAPKPLNNAPVAQAAPAAEVAPAAAVAETSPAATGSKPAWG